MNTKKERVLLTKLVRVFPDKTLSEIRCMNDLDLLRTKGIGKKVHQYVRSIDCEKRFNVEQIKHMTYRQRLISGQKHLIKQMRMTGLYVLLLCVCSNAYAIPGLSAVKKYNSMFGTASYYTVKSCQREGTSGVWTASGERYDEDAMTCAMRRRDWGGEYRVTNLSNKKSIIVRHNDFGPNKRLHSKGRIIDLSRGAFERLANLHVGIIRVKVEKIK